MRYTAAFLAILGLILLFKAIVQLDLSVGAQDAENWRNGSIRSMEHKMTETEIRRVLEPDLSVRLHEPDLSDLHKYLSYYLGADVSVAKPLRSQWFTTAACGAASLLWSIGLIVTSRRTATKNSESFW